jgi:hypothetical protein
MRGIVELFYECDGNYVDDSYFDDLKNEIWKGWFLSVEVQFKHPMWFWNEYIKNQKKKKVDPYKTNIILDNLAKLVDIYEKICVERNEQEESRLTKKTNKFWKNRYTQKYIKELEESEKQKKMQRDI